MSKSIFEDDRCPQVPGAGLDALQVDGDNAERFEDVAKMATVRSKAIEIANKAWELVNQSKWPVIKDDYGQPELYSQIYDGESLHTEQEPISVSFGEYSSRAV